MGAEIGLLSSMTQIQNLSQSQHHKNQPSPPPQQQNPNSTTATATSTWMWNPREHQEEDDSWEVRAFAEDTRNIMGTTWPPRSYTCTFCRREFRSAQALGGHMNVHRRDRARLHQAHPATAATASSFLSSHPIIRTSHPTQPPPPPAPFINVPPQELVANAGLCLLYHMPSPNASIGEYSPSNNLLSISSSSSSSPYLQNNNSMMQNFHSATATVGINSVSNSSYFYNNSGKVEEPATTSAVHNGRLEELDLELRLGHRPTPT